MPTTAKLYPFKLHSQIASLMERSLQQQPASSIPRSDRPDLHYFSFASTWLHPPSTPTGPALLAQNTFSPTVVLWHSTPYFVSLLGTGAHVGGGGVHVYYNGCKRWAYPLSHPINWTRWDRWGNVYHNTVGLLYPDRGIYIIPEDDGKWNRTICFLKHLY